MGLSESNETFIAFAKQLLESHGYGVEAPARVRGKSGADHQVDIYGVASDGASILLDLWVYAPLTDPYQVLATYMKVLDIKPSQAYLAVTQQTTSNARRLAEFYGIHLLEGVSPADLIAGFKDVFLTSANRQIVLQ